MKIVWRAHVDEFGHRSKYAMIAFKEDGTELPYSVCAIGPEHNRTYEAWDRRKQRQIAVGLRTYQDAQTAIETAMKIPL